MGIQHNRVYGDELQKIGEAINMSLFGKIPQEESIRLKKLGFIQNKGSDKFNCNVVTRSGILDTREMEAITAIAKEYGTGEIAFTTGATVEIIGIPYHKVAAVLQECKDRKLEIGGTGAKVRPVITCQGEMCRYAVNDSHFLAEKIQQLFYNRLSDQELPNKFEIAVCACPSDCISANTFDLGVVGIRISQYDSSKCKGCKNCSVEKVCPNNAARVEDNILKIFRHQCDHCGMCIDRCPFGAIKENTMAYQVYIGGRRGKLPRKGRSFSNIITSEEALLSVIDRIIDVYQTDGEPGEWFCDTVDRLGTKNIQERVFI